MRLWSLHPRYLDRKGLAAVWREGLLAQRVLCGGIRGYRNHPQLVRFRECGRPVPAIGAYLRAIQAEAARRGYAFDRRKIRSARSVPRIPVARGQIQYEWSHLLDKVKRRDPVKYRELRKVKRISPHPLFRIVRGGVEDWERSLSYSLPHSR